MPKSFLMASVILGAPERDAMGDASVIPRARVRRLIFSGLLLPGMLSAVSGDWAIAQPPTADAATLEIKPPVEWVLPDAAHRSEVDRLVELALAQHPALAAAEAEIGREAGQRFQSTRKPNPMIGYVGSEIGNEGRGGQQGLYLSQEWVTQDRLALSGQLGAWRTRAAAERLNQARLRVTARVLTQYWALTAARHRVALLSELEELLQDGVRVNQSLLEAAEVGRGPVLQAQLEKQQVSVAKRQAEAELNARTATLAATVGLSVDAVAAIPSDPWPQVLSVDDLTGAEHWGASPELAEAQAMIEAARWNLRLAQTQIVSNVDSYASVQHDAATGDVVVGLQLGMALPVHDRKSGLIRAAHAELAQSEAEYARRYRDLQTRWADAVGQYRSAVEMVMAVEQDLLGLAEERLAVARRGHQQGELDYLDLLTAQRSFLAVRQSALDARQAAAAAAVRLQTLVIDDLP